ncbi:hypothetical protein Q0590_37185 [Rhodocytophaga aerolata]|uniref:Uncharacterized protein n=3 Tax=Rhodocytophaga aerolata TaxID=455078 RepID=A0ABT8RKL2_9BACT|nr:hypothetical protein [Rhodocytophaga aerolata]MDO1451963.1 hypothetical protein [Rhodocytophaga aerolata]
MNLHFVALFGASSLFFLGSAQLYAQGLQDNTTPAWLKNSNNLYVTQSVKVGIGTSTPARNLDIYSNTGSTYLRVGSTGGAQASSQTAGIELRRVLSNNTNTTWTLANEGAFKIRNNNVELFSLSGSITKLGASITTPTQLNIYGANVEKTVINDIYQGALRLWSKVGSTTHGLHMDGNQIESDTDLFLNHIKSSHIVLANGGGKVKVNTNDGESRLNIASNTDMQLKLINSGSGGGAWRIGVANSGWAAGAGKLVFSKTNNSADATMVITPAGNVGIGLTTPSKTLQVNGTISTKILEITGGADLAEHFDVTASETLLPGTVVSIDPQKPGQLRISNQAYDKTVAGIVSGAGDVQPGMLMGQAGTLANGQHPVALTGRVYCRVDATYGAIRPGDLLTTSPTTGQAMKVTDPQQAQGAIIGKAMTSLEEGNGLVLVLVSLQ